MPITSLAYAKAYLFAEAGGRVNASLDEAEAAFRLARGYVRQTQTQAQGCVKILEIDMAGAGRRGYISDPDLDDLKGMRLEKFTIRAQGLQYDGLCGRD
jgi:hypothetical protein